MIPCAFLCFGYLMELVIGWLGLQIGPSLGTPLLNNENRTVGLKDNLIR